MSLNHMKAILEKIKEYQRIILFRHKRPDGDAVGSTKGLCEILRITYPEKEICVLNCDYSDYVAFLGGEDEPKDDDFYREALFPCHRHAVTVQILDGVSAIRRVLLSGETSERRPRTGPETAPTPPHLGAEARGSRLRDSCL